MDARSARLPTLAALAIGLIALAVAFVRPPVGLVDDAYISLRYAENLAAGRGLVFNPGERVEGYSNLLYTLVLAAFRLAGVPTILTAQLVGGAAAVATLVLLPRLSRALGADPWAGTAAAAALAATATFSFWTFRGLETPLFTCLVVLGITALAEDLGAGRRAGKLALGAFGLLSITRPEGPLYLAAAAAAQVSRAAPVAMALRFAALSSLWLAQLAFRLLYYGQLHPNTYYAKVWPGWERYVAGFAYVKATVAQYGVIFDAILVLGVVAGLLAFRKPQARVVMGAMAAVLFFAVGSGGDGMPEGRFLHPLLPLCLVLLAAAFRGRAGVAVAWVMAAATLVSPASASARAAAGLLVLAARGDGAACDALRERLRLLRGPEDSARKSVGLWLYSHLPAGSLVAVNDCGVIPYVSGLPTLDTVGLMDRHIARLPGRKHEKVDLDYVLSREPAAIVLALKLGGLGGLPYDTRMSSYGPFLSAYHLAAMANEGPHGYLVFLRRAGAAEPRHGGSRTDLLALLPKADRIVLGPDGAKPAGDLIRAGYRYLEVPDAASRLRELGTLWPPAGELSDDASVVERLDGQLRDLATRTHHGIALSLPPGFTEGAVGFELRGVLPRGGSLELSFGVAPWLWIDGISEAAATLAVNVRGQSGFVRGGSVTLDPARPRGDSIFVPMSIPIPPEPRRLSIHLKVARVARPGRPDPFEVLIADPALVADAR